MNPSKSILETPIEYVKGIGPQRAEVLQKELGVFKIRDLIHIYPFRYVDRTQFYTIKDAPKGDTLVQLKGKLISLEKIRGKNNRARLVGTFKDSTSFLELVWFQSINYVEKALKEGAEYCVFGRITVYGGKKNMAHPEMELFEDWKKDQQFKSYEPVYPSSEKLDNRGLDSKSRRKILKTVFSQLKEADIPEILPGYVLEKYRLCSRFQALSWIHFPKDEPQKTLASNRIKFDELFMLQLRMLLGKANRQQKLVGPDFKAVGDRFNDFFHNHLQFELTGAQKRVLKEIRADMAGGTQMNRLLQGDVGSGKTVVGFMSMLLAIDNGFQACMMAPTEILAQQHFAGISEMAEKIGAIVAFLSGSVKGKKRKLTLEALKEGHIDILIGTHALIEDPVVFKNLGLAIVDEQHRFGVMQRAKLWKKHESLAPHVLVMTATPIPRTLAMTVYGDLDVSVIDELPPGRKEIKTIHIRESARPKLIQFMKSEIDKGRQIYVVYPLIEESAKLELENLNDGYEKLLPHFPQPKFQISVVHGRMKPADKDYEMQRFVAGTTQIMVATTVIEVGVNVPNASVMVIENTERFGLSQLHQLRGRVGRGSEQSFCLLMSGNKLSKEAKERIATMVRTNNGFEIAEADLKLRGPGDIEGTMQSGIANLRLSSLVNDGAILEVGRDLAQTIVDTDPNLELPKHSPLRSYLQKNFRKFRSWGRIS